MEEKLIEGRIVHYVLARDRHLASLVIRVHKIDHTCNLAVFYDSSFEGLEIMWHENIPYSEGKEPGTWHWIERE